MAPMMGVFQPIGKILPHFIFPTIFSRKKFSSYRISINFTTMFAYLNATESAATRVDADQAGLLGLLTHTQQFSPSNGGVLKQS
jgi:hypothetical protein